MHSISDGRTRRIFPSISTTIRNCVTHQITSIDAENLASSRWIMSHGFFQSAILCTAFKKEKRRREREREKSRKEHRRQMQREIRKRMKRKNNKRRRKKGEKKKNIYIRKIECLGPRLWSLVSRLQVQLRHSVANIWPLPRLGENQPF